MMKSRLVLLLSLFLVMLIPLTVLGSSGCGTGGSRLENEVWTRQFGTDGDDRAAAMVADGSGNIYVSGPTWGTFPGQTSSGRADAFVAKYDTSGNEMWVRQFGTSGDDWAWALVADGSGNIYVSGDAFVAKYDASGNEVWIRRFGTSSGVHLMVADGSGNIYVSGGTIDAPLSPTSTAGSGAFLAKYDTSGNEIWVRQFGGSGEDQVFAMVADGSGNIYAAGRTSGFNELVPIGGGLAGQDPYEDALIAKFDSSGNEVWVRQYDVGAGIFVAIAADGLGNIYAAGRADDAFVGKYDASGNEVWARQFGTRWTDMADAIVLDGLGNIYVAGELGDNYAFIAKYDTSGNEAWTRRFGTGRDDCAQALAVDGSGNIFVAGGTLGAFSGQTSSGGEDAFVIRLYP